MILSIVIFHTCLFALFEIFKIFEIDTMGFIKVIIFSFVSFIAIYPKIKKDGRLLSLNEKIIFVLSTWGVYIAITLIPIILAVGKEATTPGIFIVTLNYFLSFCGIWLVVSTYSEKLFEKSINDG